MIQPIEYRKKLEGKSNAHLIKFDDDKEYVVKFFQPGFEKTRPNEWVAYCLARYLGLPVPFARIVDIPNSFSSQIPELSCMDENEQQFASLYIPGCVNGHDVTQVNGIVNEEDLAGIIVFDYWLNNRDRTRKNILLNELDDGMFQLWIIDHAEAFGAYDWDPPELEHLPVSLIKSATHEFIASFIEKEEAFADSLELIQTIPIFLIEEIVSMIPENWNISKQERKAIVTALVNRRTKALPRLVAKFISERFNTIAHSSNDHGKN